nr:intracellular protein transport protein USO1-like [Vanessa tameamea]
MAESNDVQTLEKISTEVDESQFKIILSSQCIKAQAYLVDKLRKQSEQQKQVCNFINNGNLKLETEIKLAEQEVKSLLSAVDTIKLANVELKKEMLMAKERKITVSERVNNGIKKYEDLWIASKRRYESIPFVHSYIQTLNKSKILKDNILNLTSETQKLTHDIKKRKTELKNLDKRHVIEVAMYMVHERPEILQSIRNKSHEVKELHNDIQELTKKCEATAIKTTKSIPVTLENNCENEPMDVFIEGSWPNLTTDIDNTMMLPKLQLRNIDLDILTIKLDQIKKGDSQNVSKRIEPEHLVLEQTPIKKKKSDEIARDVYVSSYFQSPTNFIEDKELNENQTKNYSENKLIHVIEDIKLDSVETYNIVSNIKPNWLQDVHIIKAEKGHQKELIDTKNCSQEKIDETLECEKIEETELTKTPNILVPPTQFLDPSQNSQERKSASYTDKDCVIDLEKSHDVETGEKDGKNNELNVSTASEDSYIKMKETIFKKHNLDLSPQFKYSKTSSTSKRPETNTVASKFFLEKNDVFDNINRVQVMEVEDNYTAEKMTSQYHGDQDQISEDKGTTSNQNNNDMTQKDMPVAGLLFTHGSQDIPDSLNVSMSTTGFDEANDDYPPCIDSSLLLSPKADVPMPEINGNNSEVLSQEVPNFLSGIRKTGFSFFGKSSSENTPDAMAQNQNNKFTFSFGCDEKKNRGGFFNIFH